MSTRLTLPCRRGSFACLAGLFDTIALDNHPSGDLTSSVEDRTLTTRLREAGDLLGIRLLDHLILGDDLLYSFADQRAGRCEAPARIFSPLVDRPFPETCQPPTRY